MAEIRGVWGIDIGQAGLKAIRLRYAEAAGQAIAVAFDYVPHPKILSQPDAVPEELISQALQTFLSRNDLKGDAVAISVPGQTALARFIQLPPVEQGKIAEIIKYEARQQIPFALEDVIWDYQTLGGGSAESGYVLEAEVGLFAMKREQVFQHLKPFTDAKLEVDLIQIAPLALYNFLSYDHLGLRPGDEVAGDEYVIILDMGADNTTLLVSNGKKIWIRNVPIGGNHFTRALTKEMKLTFAKAEHLKCNATKSPDPRAVFQAMRPVFNDYVSEIQRSIGYFSSVNRDAKITKILGLGNGFKLAGLQKFLQQNLQYEVQRVDHFQGVVGDQVLGAALFQENIQSFGVAYGLALQGLKQSRVHTSLLPREIAAARTIRRKKPWAAVAAAVLLAGLATSAVGYANAWHSVGPQKFGEIESPDPQTPLGKASALKSEAQRHQQAYDGEKGQNQTLVDLGNRLVGNIDTREYWMEIYKAVNECLPRDTKDDKDESDITKRQRIKLRAITAKRMPSFSGWHASLPEAAKERMLSEDKEHAPQGDGYLFTLEGVHYYDDPKNPRTGVGVLYVISTLLKNLQSWEVQHDGAPPFPVRKLGISHATVTASNTGMFQLAPDERRTRQGPAAAGDRRFGVPMFDDGMNRGRRINPDDLERDQAETPAAKDIKRTTFTLQFVWRPTPRDERTDQPVARIDQQPDGGSPDSGSPDAGSPDAGSPDGGSPDMAPPDMAPLVP